MNQSVNLPLGEQAVSVTPMFSGIGYPNAEGSLHSSPSQQKLQISSNMNPPISTCFLHSFQHGVNFVVQWSAHSAVNPAGSIKGSTISWHWISEEQFTRLVITFHWSSPIPIKLRQVRCSLVAYNTLRKCARLPKCKLIKNSSGSKRIQYICIFSEESQNRKWPQLGIKLFSDYQTWYIHINRYYSSTSKNT